MKFIPIFKIRAALFMKCFSSAAFFSSFFYFLVINYRTARPAEAYLFNFPNVIHCSAHGFKTLIHLYLIICLFSQHDTSAFYFLLNFLDVCLCFPHEFN